MVKYLFVAAVMLLSGAIQATTGLPGGAIAVMFLPAIMDSVVEIGALNTICVSWCTVSLFLRYRKYAKIGEAIFPLVGFFVAMPLASMLALGALEKYVKLLLGLTLIGICIYFLKYSGKIKMVTNKRNGLIVGLLSGIFSGLFSIGSIPIVAYFVNANMDKNEYMGTTQFCFLFTCAYSTVVRIFLGALTWDTVIMALPGLVGSIAGMSIGLMFVNKLNVNAVRKITCYIIAICGVWMIAAYLMH